MVGHPKKIGSADSEISPDKQKVGQTNKTFKIVYGMVNKYMQASRGATAPTDRLVAGSIPTRGDEIFT